MQNKKAVTQTSQTAVFSLGMILAGYANAAFDIGKTKSSEFSIFTAWIQNYIDFMTGPFALAGVVIGAVCALLTWIVLPKEGIIAWGVRIVIGGLAILNLGSFIYYSNSI